jgi:hypothetical protein
MMCPLPALVVLLQLLHPPATPPMPDRVKAAIDECIPKLLAMQESLAGATDAPKSEWPYEGVYRVARNIPFGYRVGGTSVVARALVESDGYAGDPARQAAVARACDFVCGAIDEPLLSPLPAVYKGGYDVRGWAHCYGLRFLLALERNKAIPTDREERVTKAITFYLSALQATEIPTWGGWNYARKPGLETPGPSSPFMTAPCVMALVEAKASGRAIDEGVLMRAIAALEHARTASGFVVYSVQQPARDQPNQIPGAIGRMVATESALFLVGRSNCDRLRSALDAFIEHWTALEKRRKKSGTHEPPYSVAPYYFFYGFNHAALAIELLPPHSREDYREKLTELFFTVREPDGTWNDRVFPRSANYGTAMSISALALPWGPKPLALPDRFSRPRRNGDA